MQPGRAFAEAVTKFAPYQQIGQRYPDGRRALQTLAQAAAQLPPAPEQKKRPSFLFVNNRLEGNALATILETFEAMLTP